MAMLVYRSVLHRFFVIFSIDSNLQDFRKLSSTLLSACQVGGLGRDFRKGKACLPVPSFFRGELLNFGGAIHFLVHKLWRFIFPK